MEKQYDRLVEWLDVHTSRWYSFPLFGLSIPPIWYVAGYDYANVYISIVTVCFFFLFQYSKRKDSLSNQLKHDEEIKADPKARNEVIGIEKLTLSELEDTNGWRGQRDSSGRNANDGSVGVDNESTP